MANLFQLKQDRHAALTKAENLVQAAENAGRELTESEAREADAAIAEAAELAPQNRGPRTKKHAS